MRIILLILISALLWACTPVRSRVDRVIEPPGVSGPLKCRSVVVEETFVGTSCKGSVARVYGESGLGEAFRLQLAKAMTPATGAHGLAISCLSVDEEWHTSGLHWLALGGLGGGIPFLKVTVRFRVLDEKSQLLVRGSLVARVPLTAAKESVLGTALALARDELLDFVAGGKGLGPRVQGSPSASPMTATIRARA